MSEQRLTIRLISYWDRLRGAAPMPMIQQFNTATIQDLWPYCLRLTLEPANGNTVNYRYDYLGKKITEIYGRDLTGQVASSMIHNLPGSAILKQVDKVIADPEPMEDAGQFINAKSRVVKYRSCLLPFGQMQSGITQVTHMIVGLSWREF